MRPLHNRAWTWLALFGMYKHGVTWYGMTWYIMVWHNMVWYGMAQYGMAWYGMAWYGMAWYGMAWHGSNSMECYDDWLGARRVARSDRIIRDHLLDPHSSILSILI